MAIKIYIDQGHNPSNPNAGAEGNGLREQDINYEVGILTAQLLAADPNYEVRLSRPTPETSLGTTNAESLAQTLGCTVCITDTDQVVAVSGSGKKDLQDQFIGKDMGQAMKQRMQILASNGNPDYIRITPDMPEYQHQAICPIISEGDVIGAVALLGRDQKKSFGEVESRVAGSAADFLGRQMST